MEYRYHLARDTKYGPLTTSNHKSSLSPLVEKNDFFPPMCLKGIYPKGK